MPRSAVSVATIAYLRHAAKYRLIEIQLAVSRAGRGTLRITEDSTTTIECDQWTFVIPEDIQYLRGELKLMSTRFQSEQEQGTLYTSPIGTSTSRANRWHTSILSDKNT
jgi:hypothetical protein